MTWTLKVRFNVCGHQCRELDITPALAVVTIALFTFLLAVDPAWR